MESTKVKGIVINSFDYKEKDMLLKIFTLEQGIITATLKGVKSAKAKLKAVKQPFCFADFIVDGEKNIITSAEVIDSFYDLSKNIKKMYCASMLLDIVQTVLKPGQESVNIFLSLVKALKVITYEDVNLYYVLDKFLLEIFTMFGLKISLDNCNNCGMPLKDKRYFNLDFSEIVCPACKTGRIVEVSVNAHKTMTILNNTDYDSLVNLKLTTDSELDVYKILQLNFESQFGKKI